MAELGIVAPIGRKGLASLLAIVADASDARLPATTRVCLSMLAAAVALANKTAPMAWAIMTPANATANRSWRSNKSVSKYPMRLTPDRLH